MYFTPNNEQIEPPSPENDDLPDARHLWEVIYGPVPGRLCVLALDREHLTDGKATAYTAEFIYPSRTDEAVRWLIEHDKAGHDAYHMAHLSRTGGQKKADAQAPWSLWADLDDGAELPSWLPTPTAIVESSPGHLHAYWRLTEQVTPARAETLNRRIAQAISADLSGWDLSQKLRTPGTHNHKPERGNTVVRLVRLGDEVYSADELDAILPPLPESKHRKPESDGLQGHTEPPVKLSKTARLRWIGGKPVKKDDGSIDRSRSLYAIACDLARAGASEQTIVGALEERDTALGWFTYSDRPDGAAQYEVLADKAIDEAQSSGRGGKRGPNQATRIVQLVRDGAELSHDSEEHAYITLAVGDHKETLRVKSKHFRSLLGALFYTAEGATPSTTAVQEATEALAGAALYEGPLLLPAVRLAEHDGTVFFDLGGDDWNVVRITRDGWDIVPYATVVAETPVRFRRVKGELAAPVPVRGGTVADLRNLLDPISDDDAMLITGWLVGALNPSGSKAHLSLVAGHGSRKSSLGTMLKRIVDPSIAPLRALPREERDFAISAINSLALGFDNISYLSPEWSDAFCRASTGGGLSVRTHYENDEEELFDFMRPLIFTSISNVVTRSDLLDRTLVLELPPLEKLLPESEVEAMFSEARPKVLGLLFDAVAAALRNRDKTNFDDLPRLADFALWVEAAAPAFGWGPGEFLAAYRRNRDAVNLIALDTWPVAQAVIEFVERFGRWEGTPTELLDILNVRSDAAKEEYAGWFATLSRDGNWPRKANTLSAQLKRLAPNLKAVGITVEVGVRAPGGMKRLIRLTRNAESTAA